MFPYDDDEVAGFCSDCEAAFLKAGQPWNARAGVWPARMQFDAVTIGYPAARAKQLRLLYVALGIAPPFPQAPTREQMCLGQTTQQGLTVTTTEFGEMPWWGACWAWLTPADRQMAAEQLLAHGDTICLIQVALDGRALYDEPHQFYSADKFPPLTQTIQQTVDLVAEAILLGFKGVWLFLDGDNGNYGYPVAVQQSKELGPAFATSLYGNLNAYVQQLPGWDGVFYGYEPPEKVTNWAETARAAGALYVGLEHSTGHIPLGEGGSDYEPGGRMVPIDTILGEFDDGRFDDSVWQILARMIGPAYIRPPEQPAHDDPPPVPFYLAPQSPRGPFYYRVFEYYIYGWVRGTPASTVAASKAYFAKCGATNIC